MKRLKTLEVILHAIAVTAWISLRTMGQVVRNRVTVPWADWALKDWADDLLRKVGAKVDVEGAEHCRTDELYVIVSNHQSLYDIPSLFVGLNKSFRMVAKKELFNVPMWGAAMRAAGFVAIDRAKGDEAREALTKAAQRMHVNNLSIWVAPEGTRSKTGQLGPFKRGAFHLAKSAGVKILPVTINHTRDILPAKSVSFRFGVRVKLTVHPAVELAHVEPKDMKALSERVRNTIASALDRLDEGHLPRQG